MSTLIPLQTLRNTRDLGGMRAADGRRILSGRLIRSGALFGASESDLNWLSSHVGCIVDLRSDDERSERPDPAVPGAESIHLPVLRSLTAGVSRDEKSDRKAVSILEIDPDDMRSNLLKSYAVFVADDYSVSCYRRFIEILLDASGKAVLWHCTGGKDRAGFASVIIESLLGVSREDVVADYLMTNACLEPEMKETVRRIEQVRGSLGEKLEATLRYVFSAREEYLEASFREAEKCYGSFQGFLKEGLGVTAETESLLREKYLETL